MATYDDYPTGNILEGDYKPLEHTGVNGKFLSAVKYVECPHSRDWYGQVSDGEKVIWEGFAFSCWQAAKLARHLAQIIADTPNHWMADV